jgi:predicted protein tyrosine phosphatase
MRIEIHSFDSIQQRAETSFAPRTSLISIGDPGKSPPTLQHKPAHTLRLTFDDATFEEVISELPQLPKKVIADPAKLRALLATANTFLFDEAQVLQIAEFVLAHKADTDVLICQCEYGQSRSAAVAAAITEYLYGNGIEIFADERYYPNRLVFKLLREALQKLGGTLRRAAL